MANDNFASAELSRRALLKIAGAGVAGTAAASILAACGSSSSSSASGAGVASTGSSTGAAGGSPVRGGTLTVGSIGAGAAESIEPSATENRQDDPRIWNLYDGLFRRAGDGSTQPYVLQSFDSNSAKDRWTLHLRSGVVWHDGSPATADDIVYTIRTWSSPKHVANPTVAPVIDFKNVRKVGPLSVEVPLLIAVLQFPSILTGVPFVLVKNGSKPSDKVPIGTGPFKYVSFSPGVKSVFSANRHYWQEGKPYVDELVMNTSFTDEGARLNALLAGDIDAADNLQYSLAKANSNSPQIVVLNSPSPQFQGWAMPSTTAPFNDVRVRQAIRLVANRPQLVESVLSGYGSVGNDLPGAGDDFFDSALKRQQDISEAKALLKAAGRSDLRLRVDTLGVDPATVLLKEQAAAVGITISINAQDTGSYYTNKVGYVFTNTSWDSTMSSLTQFYLNTLYTKAWYPETEFGTPARDKILFEAIGAPDAAAAEERWREVQELQFNLGGYLIWAAANYVDAIGKTVHGIQASRASALGGFHFCDAWKS